MYLKRIELAGFKSFADRTIIDFENQVTAIVGPNGSGKSNVTEAVRWVLGEQSAKNLRGGKMPDIIFAGSETRKPLNIAEVTIILDNQDCYLPLDYAEVSVTRRLRRTGESEFYINKQACRLKDIQELFLDSGLGKESFSIISQGKVEAIFSSKPEERRGIFEEAAGVLKYKQRKKQAEQKLSETKDNLSRVQDIVYELEEQLRPLEKQKIAANRYLELKEQFIEKEISYMIAEIAETRGKWQQLQIDLTEKNQKLTQLADEIKVQEQTRHTQRLKRRQIEEWIEENHATNLRVTEQLKQVEGQMDVLAERAKHSEKDTQAYEQQLYELQEKERVLNEEKRQAVTTLSQKNGQIQQLEKELAVQAEELLKYQKTAKELVEELRADYVEKLQEQANVNNELKYLERQYQQETVKNQHFIQKQNQLQEQLANQSAKKTTLDKEQNEVVALLDMYRMKYSRLQQHTQEITQQYQEAQQKMYQLMNELQQKKARHKSLQDIQENYTGFYQGVRLILKQRQQLTGIVGAVAEKIEVPNVYTLAIETALGAAAQHVIVETEADARKAITFLKQHQAGRATFLPLTVIRSRHLPEAIREQVQAVEGYLGVASDLITFPEKIQTIIDSLLGTTLIATDLTCANALSRAVDYRYRIVSLEGDVMNPGGSMTGGATKKGNQANLLGQNQIVEELSQQIEQLSMRLETAEKRVQTLAEKERGLREELDQVRTTAEQTKMKEQELVQNIQHVLVEIERLAKEQKIMNYENREFQEFHEEYSEKKADYEEKQIQFVREIERLKNDIETMSEQEEIFEQRRLTLSATVSKLQAEIAVNKEQASHIRQQVLTNETQRKELVIQQSQTQRHLELLTADVSGFVGNKETLEKQIVQLQAQKQKIEEEQIQKQKERQYLQQKVNEIDEQLRQAREKQVTNQNEATRLQVEKERADVLLENRLTHLQEEYQLTFEAAKTNYSMGELTSERKQELQQLKQQISSLGVVNLNAIEQFTQVSERHEFLTTQRDDLLRAQEQLFETMFEMDEEVKTRFQEVFEGIRTKFKVVFPNMFGGGTAELRLTDPNDLLHTGIEIEVQPPGKKLQNLSLLSGGERALTAIALLFSIIQVRPVPFCILDEVEAALDDANVARFGRYLRTFQEETQFIVVTHRKGTMEAAQVLYGVTMEESGVSKIVSVRLEEVDEGGKIVESKR